MICCREHLLSNDDCAESIEKDVCYKKLILLENTLDTTGNTLCMSDPKPSPFCYLCGSGRQDNDSIPTNSANHFYKENHTSSNCVSKVRIVL